MMNCWEFKRCGREPNGTNAKELGICLTTIKNQVNGINSGKNGGRCCWAVAGTLCGLEVQGTFAPKIANCLICDFFKSVSLEEKQKGTISTLQEIFKLLKEKN